MKNFHKIVLSLACAFALNAQGAVSGFADAQFGTGENVMGTGGANSPTFRVGDGAVYFTEKSGATSVTVDIPFMVSATGANNDFQIATAKAQAYIMHTYDFGLSWGLGQWDSIYGMEANDSANRRFAQAGLLVGTRNQTHTGFLLSYANGPIVFDAFASNPHGQGLRNGDNLEYGGKLKYTHSAFYISGGYMHHKEVTTAESSMFTDFTLGTKQGAFSADAEVVLAKAAAAGAETGFGLGVWLGYDVNTDWNVAGRFELASKLIGTIHSRMQWTLGPAYKMSDKVTTRLEYTGTSTTLVTGGTSESSNGGILSTVFKF